MRPDTYSVYDKNLEKVIDSRRQWPTDGGQPIPGLEPHLVWLREIHWDRPEVDPRFQTALAETTIDLEAETITFGYKVKVAKELEQAKLLMRTEINNYRDEHEAAGFFHDGHLYDSDVLSVLRIVNAAQMASDDPLGFAVHWTTQDNEEVYLDGPAMLQLQGALVMHATRTHESAKQHKAAVDALESVEAVFDYDYERNWP